MTISVKEFQGLREESTPLSLDARCIGELSFEQFREGIRLCEERGNTGSLTSLTGIPVDYFDLDISSCILTDGQVTGLDLLHYNKMEKTLIGEAYVSTVEDNLQNLVEMLRFSVIAMNKKYPQDTRFVIPYETEQHMLLVGRLFGEREQS